MVNNQPQTIIPLDHSYEAVLLNYNDYAFLKVIIDSKSLLFLRNRFHLIQGVLNKKVLVRAFFEMVKDAKLTVEEYMDFIEENKDLDLEEEVLASLFLDVSQAIANYSPLEKLGVLYKRGFELAKHQLGKYSDEDEDKVTTLKGYMITFAKDSEDIGELIQWLDSGCALNGIRLTYYNKWAIVKQAF